MAEEKNLENRILGNNFENTKLINFILKVTGLLYNEIKNDYFDSNDINLTYKYRMNVILDICRDSNKIKMLSNKYNKDNKDVSNDLYIKVMATLHRIHEEYIKILNNLKEYKEYKDEIIHLYSGMKSIPKIENGKILIRHHIDTTLRPFGFYVYSDNDYYLHIKTKLNGMIIPIIGNCFQKWHDLGYVSRTKSEFEILYIGVCDLDCVNYGNVTTSYNTTLQSELIMYNKQIYNYIQKDKILEMISNGTLILDSGCLNDNLIHSSPLL